MKCALFRRNECDKAKGLCVIIDVLRAFTTAAFAFASGAKEIILVSSVKEALQMHQDDNTLILMGEEGGHPIKGFQYGNSPADIQNAPLSGRRIVQRTSAGTQGVVHCRHADQLMIASFVVAEATIQRIQALSPAHVSFIITGTQNGDEDAALAEYLQSRLLGKNSSPEPFLDRVRTSPEGKIFADPTISEFSHEDLDLALQIDRFSFTMEVAKLKNILIARPHYHPTQTIVA